MYDLIIWDETHRQCSAGTGDMNSIAVAPSRTTIACFPRDPQNKVDIENGNYSEKNIFPVAVKYPHEC